MEKKCFLKKHFLTTQLSKLTQISYDYSVHSNYLNKTM